MSTLVWILIGLPLGLAFIYLAVRFTSAAWFKSKLEYLRTAREKGE